MMSLASLVASVIGASQQMALVMSFIVAVVVLDSRLQTSTNSKPKWRTMTKSSLHESCVLQHPAQEIGTGTIAALVLLHIYTVCCNLQASSICTDL